MWTDYKGNVQYDQEDEKEISELLVGRKVTKVSNNTLLLDDGTELEVQGNDGGCSCGSGDFGLTELNGVDNAIMSVSIENRTKSAEEQEADEWSGYEEVFTIFVYAENQQIKLAEFEGSEGNGYYGTGFQLIVKKK